MTNPVEICCDESGHDGENLIDDVNKRVFCHGSTDIDEATATAIIDDLKKAIRFQGDELKSKTMLRDKNRGLLTREVIPGGRLDGRSRAVLVDKWYFAVAKIIDTAIEEDAHARGEDLYGSGQARNLALTLFHDGPRAFDEARWNNLLQAFVSYMRTNQRPAATDVDLARCWEDLHDQINTGRTSARRRSVSEVLNKVWSGIDHIQSYSASSSIPRGELDPLLSSIATTASTWRSIHFPRRLTMIHDNQNALTKETIELFTQRTVLHAGPNRYTQAALVTELKSVDSKSDPRVQVADLIAGFGHWAARAALMEPEILTSDDRAALSRITIQDSMWADPPSWELIKPIAAGGGS